MKIVMIGQKGIPASFGGIERHVEEISHRLVQRGHDVTVLSRYWYTKSVAKEYRGVKIKLIPSIHTKHLDAISHTFLSTLAAMRDDADVIHYHGVGPALLCWIPRIFKPRAKVVTTFHCIDRKHKKWGWFARWCLTFGEWCAVNFSHTTITVSETLRSYCALHYNKKTLFIPNGFAPKAHDHDDRVLASHRLAPKQYILAVSRFIRHKGLHYLIEAFSRTDTPMKLAIAGDGYFSDEYASEIRSMAKKDDRIILLGTQDQDSLSALYKNAYLMVHPSESEGLPLVVLEALGYGSAVLGSDIPEIREIIHDPNFLFKSRDTADLKARIEALLQDPQRVSRCGQAGALFVREQYNWDVIVDMILASAYA
ncbi:MAG TPA: glycosyltransferase family 4 protein [Patescibacteria group bacterium]|nr:glycosyltransferase family 4 protein [Patescibacteria group bacterium]